MARKGLYRPAATEEERLKRNRYMQTYRAKNPEKVKRWHENYILNRAAKLQAAQNNGQQQTGNSSGGE